MVILPVLIGIAIAVLAVVLVVKARGYPLVQRRFPTRAQVAISAIVTIALVVLWLYFELSPALLPLLILIQWIPFWSRPGQEAPRTRLLLVLVVGLTVAVVVATGMFWLMRG